MSAKNNMIGLKQAAKILKLKNDIVREMIKEGVFSAKKIGRGYRIDRDEIDEWLANLNDEELKDLAIKRTICRFKDYFNVDHVLLSFEADNKYEAIAQISQFAKSKKIVRDHRWLYQVLMAREELITTGVGNEVAFLHPRNMHPKKIKKPSILYCRCDKGIDFEADDNKLVRHFFVLLLRNDKQHLFSLSFLSKFIKDEERMNRFKKINDEDEIFEFMINFTK